MKTRKKNAFLIIGICLAMFFVIAYGLTNFGKSRISKTNANAILLKTGSVMVEEENDVTILVESEKEKEEEPEQPEEKPEEEPEIIEEPIEEEKEIIEEKGADVEEKNFDLSIEKYIEKIEVISNGKSKVKNYGYSKSKKLPKVEARAKEVNATKLNITYGIRVENTGEVDGLALEIADTLPTSFKFNQDINPDWFQDGRSIKSTSLNATWLKPGDNQTLYLTLEWDLNENSLGERVNKVQITEYYNEENLADKNENIAEASIIASISTGAILYAGMIFGVVVAIVSGIIMTKNLKRKEV